MPSIPDHIRATMERLAAHNAVRRLRLPVPGQVDFTSNDYLGLAGVRFPSEGAPGSGGSRLLSGQHPALVGLEEDCAALFGTETTLLYSSGYMANLGLLGCIAGRSGVILYDQLVHASIRDGLRLASGPSYSFRHQDYADLDRLLHKHGPGCFVVAEALYSMDGDLLDLPALCEVTGRHQAWLIVDEAHSTGLYGPQGAGWVVDQGYADRVWLRIHTFGKAVGRQGAVVAGPAAVRDFLINRSRTQIYSTAIAPAQAGEIRLALARMQEMDAERQRLRNLRRSLQQEIAALPFLRLPDTDSPIVPLILPGNERVKAAAAHLQAARFDVRPILAPTVPAGTERLRVILHSYNTEEEVRGLVEALGEWATQAAREGAPGG